MVSPRLLPFVFVVLVLPLPAGHARDYKFDGKIARPVMENYLSRSITMLDLLTGHRNVEDNIRMLRNTGARFAGRAIYLWGGDVNICHILWSLTTGARTNCRDRQIAACYLIGVGHCGQINR